MKMQQKKWLPIPVLALFMLFSMSTVSLGGPSFEQRLIEDVGWSVVFLGSSYDDATDTTTFTYQVITDSWEKDLSHWVLGYESEEIPVASGNDTSFGLDPTTGLYGVKWDSGQQAGTVMEYTVTVNGNVGEAPTQYSVKGGTYFAVGETIGPGEVIGTGDDTFAISGIAFVDANGNGVLDDDEPRLGNVSVDLYNADGTLITSVLTDANGYYIFSDLLQDHYSVDISASSIADDFNEILAEYFVRIAPGMVYVNLFGADSTDNNFGFSLVVSNVLDDFDMNDPDGDGFGFTGNGKTIGYWKHQHRVAIRGKGRAHVDAATLSGYLADIEGLFLVDPFQFDDGFEFESAFDILSATSSDAVDLLSKQLLGTELNYVSGLGLSGDYMALQSVLIAWAEFLVKHSAMYDRETLITAKDICDMINNTGNY